MVFNFKWSAAQGLCTTTGLCIRYCNSIPFARKRSPAVDKDKYLEPMFGDVTQALNPSPDVQN